MLILYLRHLVKLLFFNIYTGLLIKSKNFDANITKHAIHKKTNSYSWRNEMLTAKRERYNQAWKAYNGSIYWFTWPAIMFLEKRHTTSLTKSVCCNLQYNCSLIHYHCLPSRQSNYFNNLQLQYIKYNSLITFEMTSCYIKPSRPCLYMTLLEPSFCGRMPFLSQTKIQ